MYIMYIFTALEFPTCNFDFHLLTTSVNVKYYYIYTFIYRLAVLIIDTCFGNYINFFPSQPTSSCFMFFLTNLSLTQNFVYPTIFTSVPPPLNNDRSLKQIYLCDPCFMWRSRPSDCEQPMQIMEMAI